MIDVVNVALRAFSLACAMTRVRVRHAIRFGNCQCACSSQPISKHLKRLDWRRCNGNSLISLRGYLHRALEAILPTLVLY